MLNINLLNSGNIKKNYLKANFAEKAHGLFLNALSIKQFECSTIQLKTYRENYL